MSWSGRLVSLCGASLLVFSSTFASAKDVSIAAISGYFAQGFGVSIVNGLKKAEKDGAISQDEHRRMHDDVQKMTDEAIKRIDETLKTKEQEIMQV